MATPRSFNSKLLTRAEMLQLVALACTSCAAPAQQEAASDDAPAAGDSAGVDELSVDDRAKLYERLHNTDFGLPRIVIAADISDMKSKQDERQTELDFYDAQGNKTHYFVSLKLQGTSALFHWRKNYNITFYEDASYTTKLDVDFGIGKGGGHSKWTIKANAIDGSNARNIVSARIAREMYKQAGLFEDASNWGVIDGIPVIVEVGERSGLYTLNLAKSDSLYGVDDAHPGELVIQSKTWTEATAFNGEVSNLDGDDGWEHEAGAPADDATIENFNALLRFVRDSDDASFVQEIGNFINLDAAFIYLVMVHLINGIDNTNSNIMLVTKDNGLTWTPALYDLDTTWGIYWDGELTSYEFLPEYESDTDDTHPMMISNLWRRLLELFGAQVAQLWFEQRNVTQLFSRERILAEFQAFYDSVGEEVYALDKQLWPERPGYMREQIEEFLDVRLSFIDAYMQELAERS